ncbi:hypothetical protein CLAIMM_11617 [Cladophialophora immunda]|nr:hypothetical protein CLAIMM_11617 [Cladophialophora immunda]
MAPRSPPRPGWMPSIKFGSLASQACTNLHLFILNRFLFRKMLRVDPSKPHPANARRNKEPETVLDCPLLGRLA